MSGKRIKSTSASVSEKLTLNNLFEMWFAEIRLKVKESTFENYKMKFEKHIKMALGKTPYDKLTVENLNDLVQSKLASGLSPKYTADIVGVIKSVCRYAKKRFGYDDKTEFMIIPKGKAKEKELLDKTEQARLNRYLTANPTSSNVGILLCSATGIRIGELCGMRWGDIDLEKRILTVRNTVQRIKNNNGKTATKLIVTSPKSNSSFREIPLPDFIIPLLNGIKSGNDCYLLSGSGSIVEPRTMQYRFKRILADLRLSDVCFHALRHQFATNCIELGFDVKSLSIMFSVA